MDDKESLVEGYKGEVITSVLKAVKLNCLSCMGGQREEVKECPCTYCTLWPFRLGKNPYRKKREMTEEQKLQNRDRMRKMAEARKEAKNDNN